MHVTDTDRRGQEGVLHHALQFSLAPWACDHLWGAWESLGGGAEAHPGTQCPQEQVQCKGTDPTAWDGQAWLTPLPACSWQMLAVVRVMLTCAHQLVRDGLDAGQYLVTSGSPGSLQGMLRGVQECFQPADLSQCGQPVCPSSPPIKVRTYVLFSPELTYTAYRYPCKFDWLHLSAFEGLYLSFDFKGNFVLFWIQTCFKDLFNDVSYIFHPSNNDSLCI